MRLVDNWRTELHRLWTIRISLAVGVFNGVAGVLCAFTEIFNPWFLVALSVLVNTAVVPLARLAKQREPNGVPPEVKAGFDVCLTSTPHVKNAHYSERRTVASTRYENFVIGCDKSTRRANQYKGLSSPLCKNIPLNLSGKSVVYREPGCFPGDSHVRPIFRACRDFEAQR